jgi:hypothetical protein
VFSIAIEGLNGAHIEMSEAMVIKEEILLCLREIVVLA